MRFAFPQIPIRLILGDVECNKINLNYGSNMVSLVSLVQTPVFPPSVHIQFDEAEKKLRTFENALRAVSENVTKFLAAQETAQQCLGSALKACLVFAVLIPSDLIARESSS